MNPPQPVMAGPLPPNPDVILVQIIAEQRRNALRHLKKVERFLKDGSIFQDLAPEPDDDIDYNEMIDEETQAQRSSAYMPKAGSALACHLSKVHDDVVNHRNKFILPSLNPKSGIK